jgi:predicted metalloprotease with PDZ domain
MIQRKTLTTGIVFIILITLTSLVHAQTRNAPVIAFTVSMPRPHTHLLEVEMRIQQSGSSLPAQLNLTMPVWTPGSYLIREYARNVQDFRVEDAGGRTPLTWKKVNKHTWNVETNRAQEIKVTYSVYANEFSVRSNELNDQHAFWNNTALLMYVDDYINAPSTLKIIPYNNWEVATALPPLRDQPNTFLAENFDVLYDSPVDVGIFKKLSFDVKGSTHRVVIDGDGNYDLERMQRDIKKIVETTISLMGGDIPYRDYLFILHTRPGTRPGGLEHLNSTALIWPRFGFRPELEYQNFLALVAHEFFHLWNVKRIRPDALGPFDYTKENYTSLLWVAEGITEYYEKLLLRKAGLISEKEYLDRLAEAIDKIQRTPGRHEMSVEEASFDAWIKYYRQDENSINSQISYYDKGGLIGMLLDLEIRKRSNGTKSLDDVMRYLYTEYFKKARNYTPIEFQRASETIAGSSLEEFFKRYVRGRDELDYSSAFEAFGLRLVKMDAQSLKDKAYLGLETRMEGDRLIISMIPAGSPAYEQGLNAGDQILAMDNIRMTSTSLLERLKEKRPGDTIKLTIFRFDELRTFEIRLGTQPESGYRIVQMGNATEQQKRLYHGWMGIASQL